MTNNLPWLDAHFDKVESHSRHGGMVEELEDGQERKRGGGSAIVAWPGSC